ncbi:hypothetical protein C360_05792 [Cryptococcus neoformans Bt15]|nr:hypothetical protein C360_05792 [Cryptococcus neoformans var. grubii Bt15]
MFTLDCIRLDCIPRCMPHSNSLSSLATLHSTLGYPSTPDAFARLLLSIATPQHPTHHTQLVHSHSATPPRWLNYATDEREDMQDRWQSTRWEGGTGGRIHSGRIHGGRGWDMGHQSHRLIRSVGRNPEAK